MASGNSGRNSSASKGFDFAATDDILCSYEDYGNNLESSNGNLSDPGVGSNSVKDFHKTRMARTPMFPASTYISPGESSNNEVISSVERTMKKYTENIMRFLEGISSRLSQLELYCYNLDKSIGEMRSDLVRDHEEAETKLKSLEKHLQEVHRSVQILRDKQELTDTQKELTKLQLAQKEPSSSAGNSQKNEEKTMSQACDTKNIENTPDDRSQQLALALPQQVAHQSQQQPIPPQVVAPQQSYYLQPSQMPSQPPQSQYLTSASTYQTQQAPPQPAHPQTNQPPQYQQQWSQQSPQPAQPQANQPPQYQQQWPQQATSHPAQPQANQPPQYQQQWPQQTPQLATPQPGQSQANQPSQYQQQWPQQAPQPSSMQSQIRPSASTAYSPYLPHQPANASPTETLPNSMPMQVPYSGIPQPSGSRIDASPYGYDGPVRPIQPPPQQLKSQYGGQNNGYATPSGPHSSLSSGNSYMMYQNEGGQASFYPPPSVPSQGSPSNAGSNMARPPQFSRGHPFNELIDKLVGMGYRGDHVASVIQRLEENGQSVDFNAVLDILNGHPSGGSQRGWSG